MAVAWGLTIGRGMCRIEPEATVTASHRAAVFDSGTYYFHAHWSARGPMSSRPYRDILLADLAGEGSYVGTFLAVGNSSTAWWGEGDEKVWVDDDTFPSLFGTGTEDYFGQGTCSPELYSHPFRAQTLAAGDGLVEDANGLFSMLRTHILDPIRFSTALQFDLELWHWDESAQVTFDNVSYFYLAASATDSLPLPTAQDFRLSPSEHSPKKPSFLCASSYLKTSGNRDSVDYVPYTRGPFAARSD